jgi:hypothetical protein
MVNFEKLMTNIACPRLSVPTIGKAHQLRTDRTEGVIPPAPVPNLRTTHLGAACSQAPPAPKTLTTQGFRDGDGPPPNSEAASLLEPTASTQGKDRAIPDSTSTVQVNTSLDIPHRKRCSFPTVTLDRSRTKRQKFSP